MHIAIIGNGIAGVTCARYLRKHSDHRITLISAESDHHYSRPALMYLYMGHMRYEDLKPYEDWFWEKNRIELRGGWVTEANLETKELQFGDGSSLEFDKLVLAVGSKTAKYNWPGQDLDGVHGLVTLEDVAAMERHSENLERAVIVGGGLIGVEMAECFHSRRVPVVFLVREDSYWDNVLPPEESAMVTRHIAGHHGIDLRLETELSEIWGDGNGKVKLAATKAGEKFTCGFVGIATGVKANVEWLAFSGVEIDRGILVDEYLRTNHEDIYAIGDCSQLRFPRPGRRPMEQIWYTARMQGEVAALNILGGDVEYNPGIYFNSAKFFSIEYQVYGQVPAKLGANEAWFLWQHPSAERAVRLYWNEATRAVTGFHLMGVRFRQEVCNKWIEGATPVEEVVADLGLANFDPEFYREYESDFIAAFNQQEGTSVKLRSRRGLPAVQRFLRKLRRTEKLTPTNV